jgi:hypothetical protein
VYRTGRLIRGRRPPRSSPLSYPHRTPLVRPRGAGPLHRDKTLATPPPDLAASPETIGAGARERVPSPNPLEVRTLHLWCSDLAVARLRRIARHGSGLMRVSRSGSAGPVASFHAGLCGGLLEGDRGLGGGIGGAIGFWGLGMMTGWCAT